MEMLPVVVFCPLRLCALRLEVSGESLRAVEGGFQCTAADYLNSVGTPTVTPFVKSLACPGLRWMQHAGPDNQTEPLD